MALPLALYVLVAVAFLAALVLERGLQELRMARGELAAASATAAGESVLADLLRLPADSALLAAPRGSAVRLPVAAGAESASVAVQPLGGGLLRVVTTARASSGGVLADVAAVAFIRAVPEAASFPPVVRLHRLRGWWWAPIP